MLPPPGDTIIEKKGMALRTFLCVCNARREKRDERDRERRERREEITRHCQDVGRLVDAPANTAHTMNNLAHDLLLLVSCGLIHLEFFAGSYVYF